MNIDPSTTKYMIQARMEAEGIVEKPDVVGAVFGQTEGLLGEELDLRDLQKGGRIGRIEVDVRARRDGPRDLSTSRPRWTRSRRRSWPRHSRRSTASAPARRRSRWRKSRTSASRSA